MKRALIIFAILCTLTAVIPFAAIIKDRQENTQKEAVSLLSSDIVIQPFEAWH